MITIALVVITAVTSYLAWKNSELMSKMIMHPVTVARNNEFYRFISSGFIHADMQHLGLNMYVLYIFGQTVEQEYVWQLGKWGMPAYIMMYFVALFVSSIPAYLKNKTNGGYRSLGASGATSGVVFASVLFDPLRMFLFPPVPAFVFAIGYLAYSFWASKNKRDNIGHEAHAYGAIVGLLITVALMPNKVQDFLGQFQHLLGQSSLILGQ